MEKKKRKNHLFFRGKEWEEQYTESQVFTYKPCIGRMTAFSEMCREVKLSEACKSQLHRSAKYRILPSPSHRPVRRRYLGGELRIL